MYFKVLGVNFLLTFLKAVVIYYNLFIVRLKSLFHILELICLEFSLDSLKSEVLHPAKRKNIFRIFIHRKFKMMANKLLFKTKSWEKNMIVSVKQILEEATSLFLPLEECSH